MTPHPLLTTCLRCGASDPQGPAVALGFRICLACYEWRPPHPERINHIVLTLVVALAPMILSGLAVAIAKASLAGRIDHATFERATDIAGWAAVASSVCGVVAVGIWSAAVARRTIHALAIPSSKLLLEGATPVWASVLVSRDPHPSVFRTREMACVAANGRGVLVMGPTVRLAAPWQEVRMTATTGSKAGALLHARRGVAEHLFIFGLPQQRSALLARVPAS